MWYNMICDVIYDVMWCGMIWYDIWCDMVLYMVFFITFIGMLHYIILSNTTCYLHWIYSGYFYIDNLQ